MQIAPLYGSREISLVNTRIPREICRSELGQTRGEAGAMLKSNL